LFACRLAQKLGEPQTAGHFISLAGNHSEAQLILAYHRAVLAGKDQDLAKRFHDELRRNRPGDSSNNRSANLISVRVERRAVAVAVFRGDYLEYTQARQLSSARDKALISAVGFVNWVLSHFSAESATFEAIPNGNEFHRRTLHDSIVRTLRQRMMPIWEVRKTDLFEGYGYPPLRSRKELREVATSIWPILIGTNATVLIQDAAVLGLYVQVERLFIN